MRLSSLGLGLGLCLAVGLAGGAAQAASISIKDAAVRVVVIPEARSDIQVEVLRTHPDLPLQVRQEGARVVVDGDLGRRVRSCDRSEVEIARVGEVAYRDLPQILVRTPLQVQLGASGAVFGTVGRSDRVDLSHAGCGDWTIANVKGRLSLRQAGSGDMRAGSVGALDLQLAGSGEVATRAVTGPANVKLMGSGDVSIAQASGPVNVNIAGSGEVEVASGRIPSLTASIAGSGDVDVQGTTRSLKARIAGSGDVRAREVTGPITKSVAGSGEVIVG